MKVRLGALLLFFLCALSAGAQGTTFLYFDSQPGDYIGLGRRFTLTPADGAITPSRESGGVLVSFWGATFWNLHFVAPGGQNLTPGMYEGARMWPRPSPTNPALDVSGDGRFCSESGRFVVLEAVYDAGGEVVRFAADYEQHCDQGPAALFGSVRINSSVPMGARLSVSSATVSEGDAGLANLRFVVSLSTPVASPVSVAYSTADGTATAGTDYSAVAGTASFAVGQTAVSFDVPVFGDTAVEGDELFTVSLGNPVGAPVQFGQGQGLILDDDPYKTLLSFNSQPLDYIGGGRRFTLTPADGGFTTSRVDGGVRVQLQGPDWWDLHFVPPAGTLLTPGVYTGAARWPFQPPSKPGLDVGGEGRGCNALSGRFTILEAEYGPGGEILRFAADYEQHCEGFVDALFGSVRVNSSVALIHRLVVGSASTLEGDNGTRTLAIPFWLSEPSDVPVTATLATEDGTALAGSDYVASAGTVTLPAGQTEATFPVAILGDAQIEGDETFFVRITGASGAAFDPALRASGIIVDDDPAPRFSAMDVRVFEGDASHPTQAIFTVLLAPASSQWTSISYATEEGTAKAGLDFSPRSGTLSFAPGTTSATVAVGILPDDIGESDETFVLRLSSPVGALLGQATGVATIVDGNRAASFYTLGPCRLLDTRESGPPLVANTSRRFHAPGSCGIPPTARALAVNLTVVNPGDRGNLRLYPADGTTPLASVLNFGSGQTRAGNAIVALGPSGDLGLQCDMPAGSNAAAHVAVDVFGYFE